jgi:hypothetical protein
MKVIDYEENDNNIFNDIDISINTNFDNKEKEKPKINQIIYKLDSTLLD